MTVDPLSDALAVADARSVFSGGFTAGGDWAIELRGRDRLKVNAVVQGSCLLVRDGGEPLRLAEGDVVISDGGQPYTLCSRPGVAPTDSADVVMDPVTRMGRLGQGDAVDVACVSGHIDLSRDRGICCGGRCRSSCTCVRTRPKPVYCGGSSGSWRRRCARAGPGSSSSRRSSRS